MWSVCIFHFRVCCMIANWSPVSYCRLNKTCQSSWNFTLSKLLAPTTAQQVVNLLPRTSGYTTSLLTLFCSLQITAPLPHHNVFIFNCLKTLQIQPLFFYFIWLSYLFWIHCTLFFPTITPFYRCLHLFLSLSLSLVVAEVVDLVTVVEEVGLVVDLVTVVAGEEASPVLPQPKKNLGISWKCFGHYIHIQHYSTFDFVSV